MVPRLDLLLSLALCHVAVLKDHLLTSNAASQPRMNPANLPSLSILHETRSHAPHITNAAALPGHHDANIGAMHTPLHHILESWQLLLVHPMNAADRA